MKKLRIKKKKSLTLKKPQRKKSRAPEPTRGFRLLEHDDDILKLCYYSTGSPVVTGHFVLSRRRPARQIAELIDRLVEDREKILEDLEEL